MAHIWQGLLLWIYYLCTHKPLLHTGDEMLYQAGLEESSKTLIHEAPNTNPWLSSSLWDGKTAVHANHEGFAAATLGHGLKAVATVLHVGVGVGRQGVGTEALETRKSCF